ncbi:bifunctional glycosyltransferase family 2 protein/CDP-glycerol:glycerophosphate glycerophosphotransferase [Streptomyces sp. CC77]|uniref:bifunctional glycosyltransferase/CDP-glycerol:glycerophosphate glycerophosphotransferase n=1 Tax=Streptomyces sp. CC77 TaxID=1906739 RepID=UPI0008DCDC0A|nr:bifunctional glycosyltransferase family 2 protein/CDP-glycerol:glycerophosphate glycerophosphotransferase [Streptomyces sp. CC77]OII69056.1 glycosyl transferase [Streptomyces sp. CC77]
MPRFSVIVPAYHVRSSLHACLESVLSQPFDDLEVIVVCDGVADGCAEIADEVAARDRRVAVLRLPADRGPGRARNAGLDRAAGDYVLFLDGDTALTPDALQAVADRLKETGSPDVLLYGHAHVPWTGEPRPDASRRHLAQDGPAPFTLADRPELLRVPPVVWNRAYRREFLERRGLRFPSGHHGHLPVTYPALLAAGSLATLDRVCVRHRPPRSRVHGDRDFDVFAQYDRLFAYVDGRCALARWRAPLFGRMVEDLTALFSAPGRLPAARRAEFFRLLRAHHRRHLTPGAAAGAPGRLVRGLVRLGAHRPFRALAAARAARGRAARRVRGALRGLRGALLRAHYRIQLRLPLRAGHAVFAAPGSPGYGGCPAALEERVRELVPGMRTAWVRGRGQGGTVPAGVRVVRPGTAAYWTVLARSAYHVGDTAGEAEGLVKRRGQVFLRTRHGTPIGHEGLDLQWRPAARGAVDFAALLRAADTWDHVVTANRHATLVQERAFPAAYGVLEYGSPRTDVYVRATAGDVAAARAALGVAEGHTAVLYAPARRDYVTPQPRLLDLERVVLSLGPRCVVLALGAADLPDHPRVVDVSAHPSVEELCLASDALVTDYAPLMCDFAVLDRPVVVHTGDWEAYAAARGTYLDVRACPPGAVARSEDELIDIFTTGHWRGSRSAQLRAAFRDRFCPYDDGHVAERVVRHVFLGQDPVTLPPVVPREERSPAPSAAVVRDVLAGGSRHP